MKKCLLIILSLSIILTFSGCSIYSTKNISLATNKSGSLAPFNLSDDSVIRDVTLDATPISWWFVPNSKHILPDINSELSFNLKDYNVIYSGDTSKKVIYLTFDEGYENGNTSEILDILSANNVKATFFVTSPYIEENPDLIKRMVSEGHLVGNHSMTHLSMPSLVDNVNDFNQEITDTADKFKRLTGKEICNFFRPPAGKYSQKSLSMTSDLGYKTVFWSFAYKDWDVDNQPDVDFAREKIINNFHNGEVMLLHAVSDTNRSILDDILKEGKSQGYKFELLQ